MTHRQLVKGILAALAVACAPAAAQAAVNLNKVNLALTGSPYESSSVDYYNSPYIAIDGVDGGDATFRFIQQYRDANALRLALFKDAQQILQGHAGIEDVFHDDNRFPFDAGI